MKSIIRKLPLLFVPFMLLGCTGGSKTSKNFFSHNIKTIAYDGEAAIRLSDPRFDSKYSIEFVKDSDTLFNSIVLGGGLAGKTIGERIALSEDLHSITIIVTGVSSNKNAKEGTITIKAAAIKALNPEYEGFTFVSTFEMGEKTEYNLGI